MNTIQDNDIRNIIRKFVGDSYLPAVILNDEQIHIVESYQNKEDLEKDSRFLNMTQEVQHWMLTSISTGVFANSSIEMPFNILDRVWNLVLDFLLPGRRLTKLKHEVQEYISIAETEYKNYVDTHEELLRKTQEQINTINKKKPLIKEYILKKVTERLTSMGIKSNVADYPMEYLDYRRFSLNEEFNDVKNAFKDLDENTYTKLLENLPAVNPIVFILINSRYRQLEVQFDIIKTLTRPIFEKMRSDNNKVNNLYEALKNIAEIYTDITNRFIPTVEQILDLIKNKYHDKLSEIPDDVLCLLRTITKILKTISEKCILPNQAKEDIVESTITASNNMSVEYERLKETLASAA